MDRNGVLVVGSANMDMVVKTRRFPEPGETVFGDHFGMFPGGKGANQAVCCAKLGGNVYFIGKMGNDILREKLARSMKSDGVRLEHVSVDPSESTGIAMITVDGRGQNEIVVVSGSNMKLLPADIDRETSIFSAAKIVLLQLEIPLRTVIRTAELARRRAVTVILNPAPARPLPGRLLKMVDYLTPNETELEQLSGLPVRGIRSVERAAQLLIRRGVKNVLVTLGPKGCLLVNDTATKLFPGRQVRAVDTTAAGDAFNGALAFSLASGESLMEAIPFANAVAAFSVTRMGAQSSMPTMRELESFID
ncbi:MAG: ribokinase [Bacteroidota bacterium]